MKISVVFQVKNFTQKQESFHHTECLYNHKVNEGLHKLVFEHKTAWNNH